MIGQPRYYVVMGIAPPWATNAPLVLGYAPDGLRLGENLFTTEQAAAAEMARRFDRVVAEYERDLVALREQRRWWANRAVSGDVIPS